MSVVLTLPELGESVVGRTLSRWLVKEGDWLESDQPVIEVTTDEVGVKIPALQASAVEPSVNLGSASGVWERS
jgi:pyruvate/2-oxoglutarate dehydrogenase complex dihydrolipoamide acyltransferase (E2) component